jgi:hypothetical protein
MVFGRRDAPTATSCDVPRWFARQGSGDLRRDDFSGRSWFMVKPYPRLASVQQGSKLPICVDFDVVAKRCICANKSSYANLSRFLLWNL